MNWNKIGKNIVWVLKKVFYPYKGIGFDDDSDEYKSTKIDSSSHASTFNNDSHGKTKKNELRGNSQKHKNTVTQCRSEHDEYFDRLAERNERRLKIGR